MDPLSIAGSVVGLLTAGVAITKTLTKLLHTTRDAPKATQHLLQEVTDIAAVLKVLQTYLCRRVQAPTNRESLILLDHVITALIGCVTTYSDLEMMLDELGTNPRGLFDRLKWSRKQSQTDALLVRLQNHKSSLTLMLTILQCESRREAEASTLHLRCVIEQLLTTHPVVASRMSGLRHQEESFASEKGIPSSPLQSPVDPSVLDSAQETDAFTLDSDLQASRVYRRAAVIDRHSLTSTTSTALYTTALSVFSNLRLSQISNLSCYALPIYAMDIRNSQHYVFGEDSARTMTFSAAADAKVMHQPPRPSRSIRRDKDQSSSRRRSPSRGRRPRARLRHWARACDGKDISGPSNVAHVTHIEHDHFNDEFIGVPEPWQKLINGGLLQKPDTRRVSSLSEFPGDGSSQWFYYDSKESDEVDGMNQQSAADEDKSPSMMETGLFAASLLPPEV